MRQPWLRTPVRFSVMAILLALVLALSACGDQEPEPVVDTEPDTEVVEGADEGAGEGEAAAEEEAEGEAAAEEDVGAEEDAEETADAEAETEAESETTVQEVQVVTDTAIITETEVVTETEILTDTEVTEVVTETRVIVEQEVETDTEAEETSETITETEVMTEVEEIEGEAGDVSAGDTVTDTDAVTDTTEITDTTEVTDTTGEADTTEAEVVAVGFVDAQDWTVRASTLLGFNFQNQDGEVSGELEDLLIDTSSGRVLFASVEYGGFLDLGDKTIVVPLNALQWGQDNQLILAFDEQQLENFPDVDSDWPDISDPAWDDDVAQFWSDVGIDANVDFQEASDSVVWASQLIGSSLADVGAGEGSVDDILVDLATGQVRYVVATYEGDTAEGQVLLPMQAITVQYDGDTPILMLDETIDAEAIQSAPRITEEQYPADQAIDSAPFYEETDPFWEDWGF